MLAERFLDVNKSWLKASDVLPKYLKHLKGNTYMNTCVCTFWVRHVLCLTIFSHHYMVWPYSSWHPPNPTNTCWGAVKHYKKSAMAAPTAEAWKNIGPLACCYDLITIIVVAGMTGKSVNVGKTIVYNNILYQLYKPFPISPLCKNHSQSWVVYDIVSPTLEILPRPAPMISRKPTCEAFAAIAGWSMRPQRERRRSYGRCWKSMCWVKWVAAQPLKKNTSQRVSLSRCQDCQNIRLKDHISGYVMIYTYIII